MSVGACLINSLINETAVTSNNWTLPATSKPACYQLVPSLCLHCVLHSCAWVGSQLDHDPAQIYAPVYLSALEAICGEEAFEAVEPAAGRSDRRTDTLWPALMHRSPCEMGIAWNGAWMVCWQSSMPRDVGIAGCGAPRSGPSLRGAGSFT